MKRFLMKILFHPIFLIVFTFLFISCNTNSKQEDYKEIAYAQLKYIDGYVGEANCVSCHEKENDLWKGSHHDLFKLTKLMELKKFTRSIMHLV